MSQLFRRCVAVVSSLFGRCVEVALPLCRSCLAVALRLCCRCVAVVSPLCRNGTRRPSVVALGYAFFFILYSMVLVSCCICHPDSALCRTFSGTSACLWLQRLNCWSCRKRKLGWGSWVACAASCLCRTCRFLLCVAFVSPWCRRCVAFVSPWCSRCVTM